MVSEAKTIVRTMNLWPTKVQTFQWEAPEFDVALVELIKDAHVKQMNGPRLGPDDQHRLYGLFDIDSPLIAELRERVRYAVDNYLGVCALGTHEGIELSGRAVLIRDRDAIHTHVERRESDLTIAYWPTGSAAGQPVSSRANPQFVICDPSRHLTDLRLPEEQLHSVYIAPRPGLMLVAPAHIPHFQMAYRGDDVHIQIVCNVKIKFTESYFRNKW